MRRLAAVPLLLLLGACPPDQPGATATDAATTGPTTSTTGGATGPATGATTDMSSGTSTTATTGDATTAPATTTTTTAGTSTGDATTDVSTTSTTGDTSSGGGTTGGAVTFLCDGCLCDAATTYCRKVLAGLTRPQGDPPLCPVVPEDPLLSGCVAYPDACGDTPTCDCIPNLNNNCFCEEQMGTFTLTCPLP